MSKIINPNGYVEEEQSIEGATARSPVVTQDLSGAKVDPQGNIYKEQEIGGITGRMPVVVLESDGENGNVTSVNGYTGEVTLNAADIGAAKASDLVNADWSAASGLAEILNKPEFFKIVQPPVDDTIDTAPPNSVFEATSDLGSYSFLATVATFGSQPSRMFQLRTNKATNEYYLRGVNTGQTAFLNWVRTWHSGNLPYEEGTWTPVVTGGTTTGTASYTTRVGEYVRIGKTVFINLWVVGTFTSAPSGQLIIKGAPFPPSPSSSALSVLNTQCSYSTREITAVTGGSATDYIGFGVHSNSLTTTVANAVIGLDVSSSQFNIRLSGTYKIL